MFMKTKPVQDALAAENVNRLKWFSSAPTGVSLPVGRQVFTP